MCHTEIAESLFFHFTAHQDAFNSLRQNSKTALTRGNLRRSRCAKKEHWIVQFRQWSKHADKLFVCGCIHCWQRSDTGAGLDCQVYAGNIAASRCNPRRRRMRLHPPRGRQSLNLIDQLDNVEAVDVGRGGRSAVAFDK